MSKKWNEVVSNPEYVALPYEEKLAVRNEYFDNVVAPHVPTNLHQVERAKFNDYAVIPAPETGALAALGATVDRIQAGVQTLMGDHEGAAANLAEASKYEPTVKSYKDVNDVSSAFDYATELLAGAVPYLAAPAVAAGAAALGAPVAIPTAIGLAGTAAYGAIEGGATYAEQEDKSVPRAIATGVISSAFERLPGMQGKTQILMNSPLLKRIISGGVEELATTTGQVLTSNIIGHGQDLNIAIQNLDEQLVAGLTTRTALATPRVVTETKAPETPFHADAEQKTLNRDVDASELMVALNEEGKTIQSISKEVDRIWKGREMDNTAEAAQKLQDRGAELSPVALDIETTTRGGEKINLAQEYGIGTAADKTARIMASNFKVPLIGSLVDPKKGYDTTNNAYKGLKQDFDAYIKDTLGKLEMPATVTKDMGRDIQHYVMGRKPELSPETKTLLARTADMGVFDNISQIKRMRQMTENMAPKGTGGTLGGALGLGTEAIVTGGVPVFSATIGTVGSAMAAGMNKMQKDKMKSIISGEGSPESKLEALFKALDEADFSKAGMATDISEEVKAKIKPDMGALEVIK